VIHGDTLFADIEAREQPVKVSANIFTAADQSRVRTIALSPSLSTSFVATLPAEVYILIISSEWSTGNVSYGFKMKVS